MSEHVYVCMRTCIYVYVYAVNSSFSIFNFIIFLFRSPPKCWLHQQQPQQQERRKNEKHENAEKKIVITEISFYFRALSQQFFVLVSNELLHVTV
jgi:hypothetical protein